MLIDARRGMNYRTLRDGGEISARTPSHA